MLADIKEKFLAPALEIWGAIDLTVEDALRLIFLIVLFIYYFKNIKNLIITIIKTLISFIRRPRSNLKKSILKLKFILTLLGANLGSAKARNHLGSAYRLGLGIIQNDKKAAEWRRKAADQDYAVAQYNLGVAYANGQGVVRSIVLAHMWFNLAASQGNESAAKARDSIEKGMTQLQIEESAQGALEWVEKHRRRR